MRGAGGAAAAVGGGQSLEKENRGVNMGRYKWTLAIWYSGLALNYRLGSRIIRIIDYPHP